MGWRLAALAALVCGGVLAAQQPADAQTRAPAELALDELIAGLCIGEEWALTPASPLTRELERRIASGTVLTAEQWKRVLLQTGILRIRERWPVSEPFVASMRGPPSWLCSQILLASETEGFADAELGPTGFRCGFEASQMHEEWSHQALGTLSLGPQRLRFHASIERIGRSWPREGSLFDGEIAFDVVGVATLAEALPPVSSAELDETVRRSLGVGFFNSAEGRLAMLILMRDLETDPVLADAGLSVDIDLLRTGEVVQTVHLMPETSQIPLDPQARQYVFTPLKIPLALEKDGAARREWTLRVRSTDEGILTQWSARTRWVGAFEVTLDELLEREDARNPEHYGPWGNYEEHVVRARSAR